MTTTLLENNRRGYANSQTSNPRSQYGVPMSLKSVAQKSTTSSSVFLMQLNTAPTSGTHKDYIKNMLIQKFSKRYAAANNSGQLVTDFQTTQIINNEVLNFIRNEKINRDNMKLLEAKIEQKLQNKSQPGSNFQLTRHGSQNSRVPGQLLGIDKKPTLLTKQNSKAAILPQINDFSATCTFSNQNKNNLLDFEDNRFAQTQEQVEKSERYQQDDLAQDSQYYQTANNKINDEQKQSPYKREKDHSIKSEFSNDDEWAEVDKYRQLMFDRDLQLQKQKKEQLKTETKTYLDEQVKEKKYKFHNVILEKQKNDDMVLNQVSEYQKNLDRLKIQNQRKMEQEKEIRDFQLKENHEKKKALMKAKKLYEKELVGNLQQQIEKEKEKERLKKEELKIISEEMKKSTETHKIQKMEAKQKQKEQDVKICKEFVEMVNLQEQKKRDEVIKREQKVQMFMTKMEQGVIQEENKKMKFLEDNIRKDEEKKQKADYLEDERRKKALLDQQSHYRQTLQDQMVEKQMKKRFHKEINNEYTKIFQDKISKDVEKERQDLENLKLKQKEVQETIRKQIEEKKAKGKGMSQDEFEFNKQFLKEIASKKKDLRDTVRVQQMENISGANFHQFPVYEVHNL